MQRMQGEPVNALALLACDALGVALVALIVGEHEGLIRRAHALGGRECGNETLGLRRRDGVTIALPACIDDGAILARLRADESTHALGIRAACSGQRLCRNERLSHDDPLSPACALRAGHALIFACMAHAVKALHAIG